jgi:hypothetical protein
VAEPVVVFAQGLAVVGGEDDHRPREQVALADPVEQAADLFVQVGHLAVVPGAVEGDFSLVVQVLVLRDSAQTEGAVQDGKQAAPVRRLPLASQPRFPVLAGRRIGPVRVLVVDPQEAAGIGLRETRVESGEGCVGGVGGDPLRQRPRHLHLGHGVVVVVEAGREPRLAPEHPVAHHRRGAPARLLERQRQGGGRGHHERVVAPHAELLRVAPGEERGDRGKGVGGRGVGGGEDQALPGQGVDSGRQPPVASVGADPVGAERVDAQQQQQAGRLRCPTARQKQEQG